MKKLVRVGLIMLCLVMTMVAFVGCSNKFDENKAIVVVSREADSGTRKSFMELVYGDGYADIVLPTAHVIQTSYSAVFTKVKSDPQAIAYDSAAFVTDDVKVLSVDGFDYTAENVAAGDYRLQRPFIMVYREENMTGANAKFLQFFTSAKAQEMIVDTKLSVDSSHANASEYVVEDGLTGTIDVGGGSTVKLIMDKLAEEFMRLQPGVTVSVAGGGDSGTGRNGIKDNDLDFGMVGAVINDSQRASMTHEGTIEVGETILCIDGIVVTVNKSNPITNITTAQLQNIYNKDATTKYSNWAELMAAQSA